MAVAVRRIGARIVWRSAAAAVVARDAVLTDERSGCGCRDNDLPARSGCGECHELMNRLQKLDFSIQETVLYLDAYPDCCEAKNYYHQLVKERKEVAHAYEKACGPLCAMGNVSTSSWDWTRAPWPWHPDFPGNGKA